MSQSMLSAALSGLSLSRSKSRDESALVYSPPALPPSAGILLNSNEPTALSLPDSALSSGSEGGSPLKQAQRRPSPNRKITFAPLPNTRRTRAYSTGRNLWLDPADEGDGGERQLRLRDDAPFVEEDEAGDLARSKSAPNPASPNLSRSLPTSPIVSRSSSITRKILTLGLSRESSGASSSSWLSGSSPATDIDEPSPARSIVYPGVAQQGTGERPTRRPLNLAPHEPEFKEWGSTAAPGRPSTSSEDTVTMEGIDEDDGSGMSWLKKRRAERERKATEATFTDQVDDLLLTMTSRTEDTTSEMDVDEADEDATMENADDDLSPEELAREEMETEQARLNEVTKGHLGEEKYHDSQKLGSMRRSASGTPATTPRAHFALTPVSTLSA